MTNIKVYGSGCASCKRLHERAVLAAKTLGIEGEVEYVTDIQRLIDLGVMQSPVMTINDEPAIVGYVPNEEEIVKVIKETIGT
ncbi:MAG: thioredoxin family protein [Patescibacteria group bacterium]|nr:thioredoxin family protein [Patescibacteria group bacterium]